MNEPINPQGVLLPAKCPNCGGEFPVNPSQEYTVCQYCQQPVITVNAIQNYQANHSNDRAGFFAAPPVPQPEPPKKKHTLLWILGWLFCFPVPLTILMLRKKDMNPKVKYGIIAAGWLIFLVLMISAQIQNKQLEENPPEVPAAVVTTVPDKQKETKPQTTATVSAKTEAPKTDVTETKPEPEETEPIETSAPEPTAAEIQQMIKEGNYSLVTPEFKKTMDAYEAFYDDYIAFMKKYNSGEGDMMAMLNDLLTMTSNLEEWSKKIDAIDESTLSAADDAYFLLVTLRVEQKLLSII